MFEELAHCHTRIGELILRRRRLRLDGEDIWEIILDGGYLMSSQFVAGEIALAEIALAAWFSRPDASTFFQSPLSGLFSRSCAELPGQLIVSGSPRASRTA